MNHPRLAKLIGILLVGAMSSAQALIAGGMVANHYTVPTVAGGYSNLSADVRVTREPGASGNTFWATQFAYADGTGGYIGMQQNSGSTKLAIFSIWDASGWPSAFNANCGTFGGEGVGVSCKMAYPWVQGKKYRFAVRKVASDAFSETWAGEVTDLATGTTQTIGQIQQAVKSAGLAGLTQFVENFTQGAQQYSSCSQVPAAAAVFSDAKMGGSAMQISDTETYGNCAAIAQTNCTADNRCLAIVNAQAPSGTYRLRNSINSLCADTLAGGSGLGLWACATGNANQTFATTGSRQLQMPLRSLCLQGSASGVQVTAQACTTGSNQVWAPFGSAGTLFNVGTETCMDAAGGGVSGANVQGYACTDTQYQRWTVVP